MATRIVASVVADAKTQKREESREVMKYFCVEFKEVLTNCLAVRKGKVCSVTLCSVSVENC